ncbi:U3 small nucleolar RNA-associated protein 6 homolog [Tribolium castaneum]|uniref:U3 small nucleolar RNA-associated protein 6 homolog-like Protein n=1 Tax=Tribolium castaneum TaxID=7070 RepID=D6WF28_TRICA|nr:PREDICTED: U3 small nucleolar RNA-associated protein 6 homolog [Tribolium castaneum]EEZ99856.2 U3 small nucleolar RNA-associated protein 6 homolog-like Protein [Tribolium castaneum]|eukprot:XP_008191278.1 PREDICTED: U3 small nucleolar RNA-associated protein 6 homolog [Tribolium castaneum]
MAELVQRHLESMAEEIEEMRRTRLYTLEETRLILKNRKEFEYKINGVSKNLQDFMEYITYEKVLLKQIEHRRDKNTIAERKSSIEYKILRRIKNLYEIALQRFSGDFSLCLSYFKFCKQTHDINAANIALQTMIKNCSQTPEVWQVAAAWHAHDRKDLNSALIALNKGLTLHKNSQLLYTEAIKLELSVIKNNAPEDTELQRRVCAKIETYLQLICVHINDFKFLIEILNLLELYSFTKSVQNLIIDKLLKNHSESELVWDALAQRERRGFHYGQSNSEQANSKEVCLSLCFAKYEEGLKKVSPSEKASLWSVYLDCLEEARLENNQLPDILKTLKMALKQASDENYLPDRYYIKWVELANDKEVLHILEKGTSAFPESIDLWKLLLRYATINDMEKKVNEIFDKGTQMLKENSLPLWFMYLRYYGLLAKDDVIDSTYRKALTQPPEISQVLKPRYIEWLALQKGINDARKMYNVLANQEPFCKELHSTMSKLESMEIQHDYKVWACVHQLACKQFGREDVDVWINHILFYLHFNKTDSVNENVQRIYRDAENTLTPLLLPDFKERYEKALSEL